ncbi:MAG: HAD family hydrolase, partial [Oscillatoria sp. PMC 1076.18]|nr:HAD family hydrolase [Oscillatoria sp. PMC 1076.18]
MTKKLRALIFDVDGTLAETERDGHLVAFNRAFVDAGLDWNWQPDLYGELLKVSGGKERIQDYLTNYKTDFQAPEELADFIAKLHAAKTKHYQSLLGEAAIPLRPGVRRLITEARSQKMRLAIATTSALPNTIALLQQTLDPDWFEVIAAGDIVPRKKPAPDIYDYVLEKMNLNPDECLVFEDSEHGLQAATQARLPTIITVNDYTQNQNFAQALLVLNNLGEPHQPCQVLSGNLVNKAYLDLESLE